MSKNNTNPANTKFRRPRLGKGKLIATTINNNVILFRETTIVKYYNVFNNKTIRTVMI